MQCTGNLLLVYAILVYTEVCIVYCVNSNLRFVCQLYLIFFVFDSIHRIRGECVWECILYWFQMRKSTWSGYCTVHGCGRIDTQTMKIRDIHFSTLTMVLLGTIFDDFTRFLEWIGYLSFRLSFFCRSQILAAIETLISHFFHLFVRCVSVIQILYIYHAIIYKFHRFFVPFKHIFCNTLRKIQNRFACRCAYIYQLEHIADGRMAFTVLSSIHS